MPNWVPCQLTLIGPVNTLDSFVKHAGDDGVKVNGVWRFSILNSYLPTPEDFVSDRADNSSEFRTEMVMKYGVRNVEEWNRVNWGVPRAENIGERGFIQQSPNRVIVFFETIDNPPILGLQKISRHFVPSIEFKLYCYDANHLKPFSCTIENGLVHNQKMFPQSGPPETINDTEVQRIEEQEVKLLIQEKSNE